MSKIMDCEMTKILLKKFDYLEKRVTYLEGKSRGQEVLIQKLKIKLKKLKRRNRIQGGQVADNENEERVVGDSRQDEFQDTTAVDVKPDLIELNELLQIDHQQLDTIILNEDKKLNQKLVVNMGVRCSDKIQEIVNLSCENSSIERDLKRPKLSQNQGQMTKRPHENGKTGGKTSFKPKVPRKKNQICAFCSKSFESFYALSEHMRIQTGERPFKCQICSKTFKQMNNLRRHTRLHTGEKPYSCSVCSKTFAQSSAIKFHMNIHLGTYTCPICSKKLGSKSNLAIHARAHTPDRPFECRNCKKKYNQLSSLIGHRKRNLNCQQQQD